MVKKLKLKDSIYILKDSEDIYQVIFTGTRKIKKFKVDPLVKRVIEELKTEQTSERLLNTLKPNYDEKAITKCLSALEKEGIVREYSPQDNDRYSKQISFIDELTDSSDETIIIQEKIQNSKVSVFGVGGIGTWIINGLYQIGVGEIRVTDPDKVEESNLNRQLFFDSKDIGKYKVNVIKRKLKDANIIPFRKVVSENESLEEMILGSDFLVNCADSPSIAETTRIIDKYATKYNIPYCVAGGYNMHLGMVGPIIVPGKSAKFDDFLEYQKSSDPLGKLEVIKDISQTGNLGPVAGAVANIQVMEIFKYLIGKGNLNIDRFAEIDFMNLGISWRTFGKN
ncbi:MAG: ThiF family adenylyltransferase [Candidatus Nanoarchaeia archaeon]